MQWEAISLTLFGTIVRICECVSEVMCNLITDGDTAMCREFRVLLFRLICGLPLLYKDRMIWVMTCLWRESI